MIHYQRCMSLDIHNSIFFRNCQLFQKRRLKEDCSNHEKTLFTNLHKMEDTYLYYTTCSTNYRSDFYTDLVIIIIGLDFISEDLQNKIALNFLIHTSVVFIRFLNQNLKEENKTSFTYLNLLYYKLKINSLIFEMNGFGIFVCGKIGSKDN